ncbi:pentapeptide repeat-containing protein [Streptomyces sp. NPDC051016]|uniref:pentapeptide repeat-containing protein n=1 Tax=Streptomyces sp. NPDC051016 TaxID=3365638 RepID=UPI0037983854
MKPKTKRIAIAAAIALVVVGYALLLWRGPWWIDGAHLRTKNLQPADGVVITGFRTMLVAMGAGVVAALGLYYTHKSHQQTEQLFEHTRGRDREQAELTREGQVTERYVEAIKLLSSGSLTQRLGGIYSLERIMRDSEKDHAMVVEVLAAFVRQHAVMESDAEEMSKSTERRPKEDTQAALTVLGRRPDREEEFQLDLRHADLRGVNLSKARLGLAILIGAHLEGANLIKAHLEEADLNGANLDKAKLSYACLSGAKLSSAQMADADLGYVDLQDATMKNACLKGAWMVRASLRETDLEGADLEDAYLRKASLTGAFNLTIDQLVSARIYTPTILPEEYVEDPRIVSRIKECESHPRHAHFGTTVDP